MHRHGFGERHLHIVANNCEKPHVREMAVEYMAARSIVRVLSFGFMEKHLDVYFDYSRLPA